MNANYDKVFADTFSTRCKDGQLLGLIQQFPLLSGWSRYGVELKDTSPGKVLLSVTDELGETAVFAGVYTAWGPEWADLPAEHFWSYGGELLDGLNVVPAYFTAVPDKRQVIWKFEIEILEEV